MVRVILKAEGLLRLLALLLTAATACLIGLDTETKHIIFSVEREATVKDVSALWVMTLVAWITAGYNLIHLCKCVALARLDKDPSAFSKWVWWVCLLLDQGAGMLQMLEGIFPSNAIKYGEYAFPQGVAYIIFAVTAAATQAAFVALIGVNTFQWTKVCNIYTRFCYQIGAGLLCSLSASLAMAILSPISAHHLFRTFYSKRASTVRS